MSASSGRFSACAIAADQLCFCGLRQVLGLTSAHGSSGGGVQKKCSTEFLKVSLMKRRLDNNCADTHEVMGSTGGVLAMTIGRIC